MPFKSKAQRRWMYANEPEMAKRWEKHTSDRDLPEKVGESLAHEELPDPDEVGQEYRKTGTAHAVQMDEPFHVETKEGPVDGKAGDWLVKGFEGELWPIDDEIFQQTYKLAEAITPFDDPDLDQDEAEELASQFGDYELEDEDDEDEDEEMPPPPPKPVGKPKFSMASMMKKAITAEPPKPEELAVPAEEVPEFEDEPQAPIGRSITTPPQKRRRGSYSTDRKMATLGQPKDVFAPGYIDVRPDMEQFAELIGQYRKNGANAAQIARQINDDFGLVAPPRSELPRGRGRPSEKEVPCPECGSGTLRKGETTWECDNEGCGFEMVRKLTPSDVANYLKSIGDIRQGPASTPEDLGSRVPHTHPEGQYDPSCPACTFSTSFDSEWEYPQHVVEALKDLGEFSTEEAIQAAAKLPEFQDERTGRYSDTTLPGGYKNLGDLVKQVIRGSGLFEPQDPNWSKIMFTPAANRLRWRYVGGGLEEGRNMGDWYCPSCEEGNHHRCRSERCACCGGNAMREMFTAEAVTRPLGSKPFQDWNKLGEFGSNLKQQADSMKGAAYQTEDGKILFYKNQMGVGEQPLTADLTKGVWSQDPAHPSQGTMQSVFAPKTSPTG